MFESKRPTELPPPAVTSPLDSDAILASLEDSVASSEISIGDEPLCSLIVVLKIPPKA